MQKLLAFRAPQQELASKVGNLAQAALAGRKQLETAIHKAEGLSSEEEKAKFYSAEVSAILTDLRQVCDEIENAVADDLWPLPKYREMLFIS